MLQEERGVDRPAVAPARVLEIGDGALDELLHVGRQRHSPDGLPRGLRRIEDLSCKCIIVAEESGDPRPERDHDRPGERRQIDDGRGLLLDRPREHVRQYQPAFGVGVEDLDGEAVLARDHVAGLVRRSRRHVLAGAEVAAHRERRLLLPDERHRRDHRRRARHVDLHGLHARRGLDRQPARVERNRLANQRERRALAAPRRLVRHAHQLGLLDAALRDAEKQVHPQLADLRAAEHLDPQPVLFGDGAGRRRKRRGRDPARRLVDEIAGEAGGLRDALTQGHRLLRCFRREQSDFLELERLLLAQVFVESISAQRRALGDRLRFGRCVLLCPGEAQSLRSRGPRRLDRLRRGVPQGIALPVRAPRALPQADHHEPLRAQLAVRVQRELLALLAGELLLLGDAAQEAAQRGVEVPELRVRELALPHGAFGHEEREEVCGGRGRSSGGEDDFHGYRRVIDGERKLPKPQVALDGRRVLARPRAV